MFCPKCGEEIHDEIVVCANCGVNIEAAVRLYHSKNSPSIGLNILSLVFPFIGLILYFVYCRNMPDRAKEIGQFTLIGFLIGLLLRVI